MSEVQACERHAREPVDVTRDGSGYWIRDCGNRLFWIPEQVDPDLERPWNGPWLARR